MRAEGLDEFDAAADRYQAERPGRGIRFGADQFVIVTWPEVM